MTWIIGLYHKLTTLLERAEWLLPTVARLIFAAVLLVYYWVSGLTKISEGVLGVFTPSVGAYAQIFPRVMESVGYDTDQLSLFHTVVVTGGTVGEFVLPALIVLGFLTRFAALGMIGFIVLQSLTDLIGHHMWDDPKVLGAWFDRFPDGLILDQRAFWVFLLLLLVIKGAGPISFDRALMPRAAR